MFSRKTRMPEKTHLLVDENLERYGRTLKGLGEDSWTSELQWELRELVDYDPARFLNFIYRMGESEGGWTAVGACELAINMSVFDPADPRCQELLQLSVTWCAIQGVPPHKLTQIEHRWWFENTGNGKTYPAT